MPHDSYTFPLIAQRGLVELGFMSHDNSYRGLNLYPWCNILPYLNYVMLSSIPMCKYPPWLHLSNRDHEECKKGKHMPISAHIYLNSLTHPCHVWVPPLTVPTAVMWISSRESVCLYPHCHACASTPHDCTYPWSCGSDGNTCVMQPCIAFQSILRSFLLAYWIDDLTLSMQTCVRSVVLPTILADVYLTFAFTSQCCHAKSIACMRSFEQVVGCSGGWSVGLPLC